MKVATFNCNSVRSRLEIILGWLDKMQPDVLALQETKVTDEQFPLEAFEQDGWQVSFKGQKSYNGVAMVTKNKPESVSFGLGGDDGESDTRLAHIVYGKVNIINTYVPQGRGLDNEMFPFKLEWFARLKKYIMDNCKGEVLWVGDLNVAPTAIDVHDSKKIWPHVCHCQEVIDAFNDVLELGFVDVFRKHLPEDGVFTFWDYRVRNALQRGLGWRIDHILATKKLAAKSVSCLVDTEPRLMEKPSDHTFVLADFAE